MDSDERICLARRVFAESSSFAGRPPAPPGACLAFPFAVRLGRSGRDRNGQYIDLAAEFDPAARMDLLRLGAVERRIAELLGSPVDLLPEPVEKRRLQDQINRDRRRAF